MNNFTFHNPTKIVFGKGSIAQLGELIPSGAKILMTYGGGSIKRNGVYDQAMAALEGRDVAEFGGIEPNPRYETCINAARYGREIGADFLLSVGGGSTLDGTKFIAAAMKWPGDEPWDILSKHAPVKEAVPLGCVLTLPATGSESNSFAVVSRESTREKLAFGSPAVHPLFAVLDPETTYTLPAGQTANGIVDAFAHVLEQYMTYPVNAAVQDRFAEGLLLTLIEEGPKALARPRDYDARANVMWAATLALNGLIGCGVPQDWATHMIGHELTAFYGVDHAQSLAIVFPALLRKRKAQKKAKLLQYAERVWGVARGGDDERIEQAIAKTEAFFRSLGIGTRLEDYGIAEGVERVGLRFEERGQKVGERQDIDRAAVDEILALARAN